MNTKISKKKLSSNYPQGKDYLLKDEGIDASLKGKKVWEKYTNNIQMSSTDSPKWELVEKYLPLLKSIVARMRIYFPSNFDVEDIYSLGMAGLIGAITKYDPTKEKSFGSYASLRIRGEILDELRRMDWMPRAERIKVKEVKKSIQSLEQSLGHPATEEEIQKNLKISPEEYSRLMDMMRPISFISFDKSNHDFNDNESGNLADIICDLNEENARESCEKHELIELVRNRINQLSDVPKKVLVLYYYEGLRLAEIGAVLNLTESRVCQIHTQVIIGLKGFLDSIRSR